MRLSTRSKIAYTVLIPGASLILIWVLQVNYTYLQSNRRTSTSISYMISRNVARD